MDPSLVVEVYQRSARYMSEGYQDAYPEPLRAFKVDNALWSEYIGEVNAVCATGPRWYTQEIIDNPLLRLITLGYTWKYRRFHEQNIMHDIAQICERYTTQRLVTNRLLVRLNSTQGWHIPGVNDAYVRQDLPYDRGHNNQTNWLSFHAI